MKYEIEQVAKRIQYMRDLLELSPEYMAAETDLSIDEYLQCESGEVDFTFTFLYRCSELLGIDLSELLTGEMPKLSLYSLIRKGKGLAVKRRDKMEYDHLAYLFKNRIAEPFLVTAPYHEDDQDIPIKLSHHAGQEIDYILKGTLRMRLDDHEEILREGDCIYYDSSHGHGMIAIDGEECQFIAIVMKA